MFKLLTTLSLVAAQAVSWSAGALYVCVSSDGQVCLDGGPQGCGCCTGEADHPAACLDECGEGCEVHSGVAADPSVSSSAPCDCSHEQLNADQVTPLSRHEGGTLSPLDGALVAVAFVPPATSALGTSHTFASADAQFAATSCLAQLASVVIRC